MAEITLKYDARNVIAKKTIDYILSIGVFKSNVTNQIVKPVPKLLTPKQNLLINRLKKIKKEVDNGTFKGQSLKSFLNEI